MEKIITRFAPSPTGYMHIGSVRALLLPYFLAKKNQGKFILRIDDTDKERSKDVYTQDIFNNINWLNIKYDETFKQSDNINKYDEIFNLLKEKQYIYECYESAEQLEQIKLIKRAKKIAPIITREDVEQNNKNSQPYWRFDLQLNSFEYKDIIQGDIKFGRNWSDPVIKKPDGSYTYSFCSVIDDIYSNVTHIVRGEEHLSNAAIQQQMGNTICKLLNISDKWNINFAHFSLFLNSDGSKLSKRDLNSNLHEINYLEPWSLWSVMHYLGSNRNQIISCDENEYFNSFDIKSFSKSKQHFTVKTLEDTNKKILHISPSPKDCNKEIWDLLKTNGESRENIYLMMKHLQHFIDNINSAEYESIRNFIKDGYEIGIMASQLEKTLADTYRYTYQQILGQNFGPKINDLFNYIRQFIKI